MPYLVKVGYYEQEGRLTSQGYFIKRSGKKVITHWGGIYVKSNPSIKYFWKYTQEKIHSFSSEEKAKDFLKKKISYFLKRDFDKLPNRYIIYSRKSFDNE